MKSTKFTPISKLGEFKLIDHLVNDVDINSKLTEMGIGDDAAVIPYKKNEYYVISTDMLVEGVHFDPTYTPLKHLGYKAVVANVSDICAMNGIATHVLVSLAIPNKYSVEHVKVLYDGVKMACKNYNIDIIGGDTTSSSSGLIISVCVIGKVISKNITYRNGAKSNDLLCVSGDLGAAYLGLQILEREKHIFNKNKNTQPELENYKYILERQLKPEARVDVIDSLNKNKVQPSSMIDLSDGLSSDIMHICKASNVGVKLFENKIPLSDQTKETAAELNINPTICALHGGEDYELLFTVPLGQQHQVELIKEIHIIGYVTPNPCKIELINSLEESIDISSGGWDSFTKK